MRAVDTNVLVRLIARDDAKQVLAAEAFVAKGAWVSQLVLAEACWVLVSVYGLDARQVATTVDMLLNHGQLTIQDAETVSAALQSFRGRPAVDFTDHLLVEIARRRGHLPIGTFDKGLAAVGGAERL